MKSLLMILLSVALSLGASAQRKGSFHHSPRPHIHTRVIIVPFSYGFGYAYPFPGYSPYFGYWPPYYGFRNPEFRNTETIPYQLSLQIQKIRIDYSGKINAIRNDKSIKGKQRRQEIRALKTQREKEIIDAKINFHPVEADKQNQDATAFS